ncbi:unnamed protein product [Meloidogyne enterolobii]|uniref:Uncharacterized protein n=1 Tax=Meloidogyne enterolobii TaxID=390850 RepID=A0ACB0ZKK6_MELEN
MHFFKQISIPFISLFIFIKIPSLAHSNSHSLHPFSFSFLKSYTLLEISPHALMTTLP